jgi:hypothetical protein
VTTFAISRGALLLMGVWAVRTFPLTSGNGAWQEWNQLVSAPWIAILSRWDGRWYYSVAHEGYTFQADRLGDQNANVAPLLPALMWLGGHLIGRDDAESLLGVGIIISNLALLLGLGCLSVLVHRVWGGRVATRTLLALLVFPTSFFLSAVYSEALFLAPAVGAFVYATEREPRWWRVGALGALAALARTYGVLIALPLAYEYVAQHRWRIGRDAAWLALIPAAFLAWLAYLWLITGEPLAMAIEQAHRGRSLMPPWQVLQTFFSTPVVWTLKSNHSLADLGFVLGLAVLVVLSWGLRRRSLGLFASVFFLPMISSGLLSSVGRFGLELFPAFIVLGHLTRWRPLLAAYLLVASCLSLYLMARFALGYWVA